MYVTSTLEFHDLREPEQWEQAGRDRQAFCRHQTEIHTLTNDVIVIEFRASGTLGATA
jgi:hypothetical protein